MKLFTIEEPELQFAGGAHICPKAGITRFDVYDSVQVTRRERIHIGGVGGPEGLDRLEAWLRRCQSGIPGKSEARLPNLFAPFPGFNKRSGFRADLLFDREIARTILNKDFKQVGAIENWPRRVEEAVDLYYREIKFLAQNRTVDVIMCVLPDNLYGKVSSETEAPTDESLEELAESPTSADEPDDPEEEDVSEHEHNFRRLLKARAMGLGRPIQIVREASLGGAKAGQQDDATKAWNLCTALYYKSGQTIPWKLVTEPSRPTVCAIGISFYRSRDRRTLNTSLAQIFDELGNGLILRGTPLQQDKDDRRPYMTEAQAGDLFRRALMEYRDAVKTMPSRVVVHKSSHFRDTELAGLRATAKALKIDAVDFVTVMSSSLRLFRGQAYPPYRGVRVELDANTHVLYTRGSVPYYKTYTGKYIPSPLEVRIVESEESAASICREILALTKMNWNNTQFDGKWPVTIGCSRRVGEILKYVHPAATPQIRYSYYM